MISSDQDQTSQPLEMSSSVWIVVACVIAVGVWSRTRDRDVDPTVRDGNDRPVIARLTNDSYRFPYFGFEIRPSDDWWHLSLDDAAVTTSPIFVNQTDQSIVLFRHADDISWGGKMSAAEAIQYGEIAVRWLEMPQQQFTMPTDSGGPDLLLSWPRVEFRHVGRLTRGDLVLWVMVVSARAQPTENVVKLLESIRFPIEA